MITIMKKDIIKSEKDKTIITAELRGLSTDTKPTTIDNGNIGNGTMFIEMDTGKVYFYDEENQQWREF